MITAPPITGTVWFNLSTTKESLSPQDQKDRVILVDFWTYSCINCQRTLPYIREWWEKYKEKGLLIIGVHTPEFEFEKDPKNVEQAIKDLHITWPVVLDNDFVNWNNFANHYWPAKYVITRDGRIGYQHFGEGEYAQTERAIQEFLGSQDMPKINEEEHEHGSVCFVPTPETYCGYYRGKLTSEQKYKEDGEETYVAPEHIDDDSIALDGTFFTSHEFVESREENSSLLLKFRATEVNLVLHPVEDTCVVSIKLNGRQLKDITITTPTLYNLVQSKDLVEGTLEIVAKQGNFQAYAFTFSGCTPE